MKLDLKPIIKNHPRLPCAVVYEILRDGFAIECGSVVSSTLEKAVEIAKTKIAALFPHLNLDGIHEHVQLQDGE